MKNLITFSLCVFLSFSAICAEHSSRSQSSQSENDLLRFVAKNQGLRQFALFLVMEERCYKYLPEAEAKLCSTSSSRTLAYLDFDLIMKDDQTPILLDENDQDSFVFLAFKQEFIRMLGEAKTSAYLKMVHEKLNDFLTGRDQSPASLWEESVKFFGNDEEAARSLAILFQDTSPRKLHLEWLAKRNMQGSITFTENRHFLERIIDTINFIMDTSEASYRELFYPKALQKMENRNIYHFYVPLYLSKLIHKSGMKKTDAVLGPLMMTLSYEFITSAPDLRYLFKDPEKVSEHSLHDLLAGHSGGRFGLGLPYRTFEQIKASFGTTTANGISSLLK